MDHSDQEIIITASASGSDPNPCISPRSCRRPSTTRSIDCLVPGTGGSIVSHLEYVLLAKIFVPYKLIYLAIPILRTYVMSFQFLQSQPTDDLHGVFVAGGARPRDPRAASSRLVCKSWHRVLSDYSWPFGPGTTGWPKHGTK